MDFRVILEGVKHLYSEDNGRPALDPVVLFKLLFLDYLYGVRSERQPMQEVEVDVAYRWLLGLKLTDKVPDASTLSQNRRRFAESTALYTDSTHLKASANKHKYYVATVRMKPGSILRHWIRRSEKTARPAARDR